ncbi:MAG: M23 family metallopeptidase [Solirubrobacteraceae bacterium]
MGVDYDGWGPILALGRGKVTMASDHDIGPPRCWGRTCWPVGGIVVYRLEHGPFAGKYVYNAENIAVNVIVGQTVRAGQQIATLRNASPYLETGWASGDGPQTLAIAEHQQDPSLDPGAWSTIEGRNFDRVLTRLGAPSGILQPKPPHQSMPAGWPRLASKSGTAPAPRSSAPISEGSTVPR